MDLTTTSNPAPPGLAEVEDTLDAAILDTLITEHPTLFSYDEIVRHFSRRESRNDRENIQDALARLIANGLIHCHNDFYFATRTIVRARQLAL